MTDRLLEPTASDPADPADPADPTDPADASDEAAVARLSTRPTDVRPARGLFAPLRTAWRRLTSMRTALQLLFLLAVAAIPGSLVPQRGSQNAEVTKYFNAHPTLAPILDKLSMFNVFGSPWFAAVYLLLFVSLIGCLVPRIRLHARALRSRPPATPRHVDRLPASDRWQTDVPADEVLAAARRMLRGRWWRTAVRTDAGSGTAVRTGTGSVAAEKGYLRETGNLLFHVALLGMLVAVAMRGLGGYNGEVLLVEGQAGGFSNVVASYDQLNPGRAFSQSELTPFWFHLDDFKATYQPDGEARSFDAHVTWGTSVGSGDRAAGAAADAADAAGRPFDISENHPLVVGGSWFTGGTKVYLAGHGYAPAFIVRDPKGHVVYDGNQPFLPTDSTNYMSQGVVKVDAVAPPHQIGLAGSFLPSMVATPNGLASDYPGPRRPRVTLTAYHGDLGVDSGKPQSVYDLDFSRLTQYVGTDGSPLSTVLAPGQSWKLPDGTTVTFTGFSEFADFHINDDPGKRLALLAASAIVLGLLLSLRIRRRRLWVRASRSATGDGTTLVEVGGLARTDSEQFTEEFAELVRRLRTDAPEPAASGAASGAAEPRSSRRGGG